MTQKECSVIFYDSTIKICFDKITYMRKYIDKLRVIKQIIDKILTMYETIVILVYIDTKSSNNKRNNY